MIDDWLNQNPNDDFDPNDHGIEMDEIAKLHAMADMKEDQKLGQESRLINSIMILKHQILKNLYWL